MILLLTGIAAGYWLSGPIAREKTPDYDTVTVVLGDIEESITAQGKLEPKEFVDIGSQVTGQLQKIHVEIGDNVRRGQLLVEIDPRIYAARVQEDQARIKSLQAQLLEQEAQIFLKTQQLKRNRRLMEQRAVSQDALQTSEADLNVAEARAASIRAQMDEAQSTLAGDRTNLGYTRIYASMDGTVVQQSAREGQTLNANQQTPMLMQLAKLDVMTVRAQVAEADISNIQLEMPVYFTTLGQDERRWTGLVRQILPSPQEINNVVLYNVLVDVDNPDRHLMSGMSAQMFFVLGKASRVPLIPVAALRKRVPDADNDLGKAYRARTVAAGKIEEKTVYIGLKTRRLAEVRSGLVPGDPVITIAARPAGNSSPSSDSFHASYPRL
ncbi:MAG: efflux RND transporter periplasmic adaptor subunit [Methylococcales bacterium]